MVTNLELSMERKNKFQRLPENFLSFTWWEVHEAAFFLSGYLTYIAIEIGADDAFERVDRRRIYVPEEISGGKKLEGSSKSLCGKITRAVDKGKMECRYINVCLKRFYGSSRSFFIRSDQLIDWFLLEGELLPKFLQEKLNLFQLPIPVGRCYRRVRNQVLAQIDLMNGAKQNLAHLVHNGLVHKFGLGACRTRRRDIRELFDSEGKRGRPSRSSSESEMGRYKYSFRPIPEVMQKSYEGIQYDIPSLKTIVKTLTQVKIDLIGIPKGIPLTRGRFLKELFNDEVFKAYIPVMSGKIENLIRMFYLEAVREAYPSPKNQARSPWVWVPSYPFIEEGFFLKEL
jgi:hypothetical protein